MDCKIKSKFLNEILIADFQPDIEVNLANRWEALVNQHAAIETWFLQQFSTISAPIYTSVDLRFAGYKLAAIDTNLFPAGFNNLHPADHTIAIRLLIAQRKQGKLPEKLLIIPENHSRNVFYWQSVATLSHLLTQAGCTVYIGSIAPDITQAKTLYLPDETTLLLSPVQRTADTLHIDNFIPDAILLNHDLSEGVFPILQGICQPFLPPLQLGWHQRQKSQHFTCYQHIAKQFADTFHIDVWQIDTLWHRIEPIDFVTKQGLDTLQQAATNLFAQITQQYQQHQINVSPFLMLKANAGTYGQAVLPITMHDDLSHLNQSQRRTMQKSKGKQAVNSVILQEGVYTYEQLATHHRVAEPVIYLMNGEVIGGFYRTHTQRNHHENLNSPGMIFHPFPLAHILQCPDSPEFFRCYLYSIVARLATLAAGYEIQGINV
jgi:glutamate--cysteine ligase